MTDSPKPVPIEPQKSGVSVSVVWIIPILALLVAFGVAWQSYAARGPLITIEFSNGAGISARETEVKYRDVTVGVVEEVSFTEELDGVVAHVRLDKSVAPYVDAGSSFWVVRPELSVRGVSGLGTVLTGVFIEGTWDSEIGLERNTFRGLDDAPLFRPGRQGLQIALRTTPGGTLTDNAPIIYRGIEVGQVGKARIAPGGSFAIAEAIIYNPHGNLINASTRFWDISGFSLSIGPQGAEIDFSSVASLISGGLTFDTFVSGGRSVSDGTVFEVYSDQARARASVFNASEVDSLEMRVIFDDNIGGLSIGAAVELSGLKIGTVSNVAGIIDFDAFGDNRVRLNATLAIQPASLGLQDDVTPEAALRFLTTRVQEGLRARLASSSLLTGELKVELIEVADASPESVVTGSDTLPRMPSTKSEISDTSATVEGVFSRINNLPIEELLNSAIGFMNSAQAFISDPDLRATPQDLRGLMEDVRGVIASDDVKQIPVTLNSALAKIEGLLAELERQQLSAKLIGAIDAATEAAANAGASFDGVPDLVAQLENVAAKAESLPLEELTRELTGLAASANAVVGTQAAQDLPAALGAALTEINATLSDLRAGGAVDNVNATLASTRSAADAVATSTADLPALVERMAAVLDQASATIAGFDQGKVISRDAQSAMRDISKAAEAITALARMLERDPSALIRGR